VNAETSLKARLIHNLQTHRSCLVLSATVGWLGLVQGPSSFAAVHYGASDVSTAVAVDDDYMFVADDENQVIRLFARNTDGLALWEQDFTADLALTDLDANGHPREVDIEASMRVGNRIYWLGSHSNCGGCNPPGEQRPNRNRLFATDIVGSGEMARLEYVGRYHNLKQDLIAWDNTNGHGLGAKALQLQASAAPGVPPENGARNGFNLEGLSLSPDGRVAYLGFRSPLTPRSTRTNALVIPLLNFSQLVTSNPARGPARFGPPVELILGGRGVRSLDSSSNGVVIIAGSVTNKGPFCLYTWGGTAQEHPVERFIAQHLARPEGLIADGAYAPGTVVQLIDEGSPDFLSEYAVLGPAIPALGIPLVTYHGTVQLSILGRVGLAYDIEVSENGGAWQFLAPVQVQAAPHLWEGNASPSSDGSRIYRLRYPSRGGSNPPPTTVTSPGSPGGSPPLLFQ
jgi:hypothetical protein